MVDEKGLINRKQGNFSIELESVSEMVGNDSTHMRHLDADVTARMHAAIW
jgi:hypothetical protein